MPHHQCTIGKLVCVLLFVPLLAGANSQAVAEEEEEFGKITVYNRSNYFPKEALESFSMFTNIDIDYQTFDSNEEMYERIKEQSNGEIDVVIPSGDFVSRMQKEGLLLPIDLYKIRNLRQLDPSLLNRRYDRGNKYSLPYVWGSTGIAVNTARVDPREVVESWKDLWDEQWKGRILLTDDPRDGFHVGLKVNGYSTNTQDSFELQDAFRSLSGLMPLVSVIADELPHQVLLDGHADIGVLWSGEALLAQKKNSRIRYVIPKEGAAFWTYNFAIPADSDNAYDAHRFINFMLSQRIAKKTVEVLGYATANLAAKKNLPESIRKNPIIFPESSLIAQGEFQVDPGRKTVRLMNNYWQRLRKEANDDE